MLHEKKLRLLIFIAVAALHAVLLLFIAFNVKSTAQEAEENARVMKLTDLAEAPPPPPEELPQVESIAETMIETDVEPLQTIVAPGSITTTASPWDDYLPAHNVSVSPKFDERDIMASLVYPPIAHRSGKEGRVILELFVDKNGLVQQIRILREEPQDYGFGEAAIRAFTGRRGTPALANEEAVSCRFRYPVSFRIK
jgi:protein TonB